MNNVLIIHHILSTSYCNAY